MDRNTSCGEEIILFLVLRLIFFMSSSLYFLLFFQVSIKIVQEKKFCCIWVRVILLSQKLIPFSYSIFSASVGHFSLSKEII